MDETMEDPRMTTALREFGCISKKTEYNERTSAMQFESNPTLSWRNFITFLLLSKKQNKKDFVYLQKLLRDLLSHVGSLVGEEESVAVKESIAVELWLHFADVTKLQHADVTLLKEKYGGHIDYTMMSKCHSSVIDIVQCVGDDVTQSLREKVEEFNTNNIFGHKIKFSGELPRLEEVAPEELKHQKIPTDIADSFRDLMQLHAKKDDTALPVATTSQRTRHNMTWLKQEIKKNLKNHEQVLPHLIPLLMSDKESDHLQNELFDLIGFDSFQLIQTLLENRSEIKEDFKLQNLKEANTNNKKARPNYGCQVTVQTVQEKEYEKALLKEEKRNRSYVQQQDGDKEFDLADMREKRYKALQQAKLLPKFSNNKTSQLPPKYPFVFDAQADIRQAAAFIGGVKMALPDSIERESTKMYEQIRMPPIKNEIKFKQDLVLISQLDEVGQLAFRGLKSLNRVQSCVFDSAYNTNENLLISAPTGAGKTNCAMLAIVREIKRNIVDGVIQRDKFKIVYVAPMKALACEMTANFGKKLEPLGILVRELTGDMQLTKREISETQMLVTTPEKWDVVTRKSTGDTALSQLVKLIIIDEVHLLHDERGPVLETLVARTLRQVETQQTMIRIVGLSATLPNYIDVALFLRVNPHRGLFYFDSRFRPVPLEQTFVGVKSLNRMQINNDMTTICYDKVVENVKADHQVLVFVHARNATVRTGLALCELMRNNGDTSLFDCQQRKGYAQAEKQMSNSRNRELRELFKSGFGTHHAGMLRQDRVLVQKLFSQGFIRVLCCTATLAWGVNLPAHAVIIKGTEIYDAKHGSFVDLGILDVLQIFGRAGRPQFDTSGEGTIITTYEKLARYLSLMTRQNPIESQFIEMLTDNLNAEISLGTVASVNDAVKWLSYTYLHQRMRKNPLVYGIAFDKLGDDPMLENWRSELVKVAGRKLDEAKMIRFDERTGYFFATDLGRTASHFYIKYSSIETINEIQTSMMSEEEIFVMISKCSEFDQIKVRDDELDELDGLIEDFCEVAPSGSSENIYGKVNVLLQTYISRGFVKSFSLSSDLMYVAQNAGRIVRGLFEMALKSNKPLLSQRLLQLCKCVDKRMWPTDTPMRQFLGLKQELIIKIENKNMSMDKLRDLSASEIGHMLHHPKIGTHIKKCVGEFPCVELETSIQPITRTVLRIHLSIIAAFKWNTKIHGSYGEPWWIWIEDTDTDRMYYSEYYTLLRKHVETGEPQELIFTIPIVEPMPAQYMIRMESDRWLGAHTVCPMSFKHLVLPERHPPHTELLDLTPLPVTALDEKFQPAYNFTHFNPIQTQIFHALYHNDCNVLLGAPTGSGKTVAAELAIFRMFKLYPECKAVYIAPMKALVRERMDNWGKRLTQKLGLKLVELTGDVAPDMRAVAKAHVIITTPEKWDGVSRSWQTRNYVRKVCLIIIDEIHLLGENRGPVLEVIVSRANFISSQTERPMRIVGLSTALANARDLADWLGIKQIGLFNFRPSVRPVPMSVHIHGFPGKHYCPRMATMNKPCFQAIRSHSPTKPVLIFVASRRQTRLTALDLIAYLAAEDDPKQWMHMDEQQMEDLTRRVKDNNLRLTLAFGIGIHHAGLVQKDRSLVEELFVNQKIQVLVATATVAWGVNFPAHLVIVKGTEYFDGKTKRYIDFPITDVLQMMGRAGRPQYDDQAVAVVFVHDTKKHFYKKFLYEPFPVESSLLEVLADHLNAEVVAGTITSKQDALDYLTWTYFFRRLVMNPSYYNLMSVEADDLNNFLSNLIETHLFDLQCSGCVAVDDETNDIEATPGGKIASYYYLSHKTIRMFQEEILHDLSTEQLLKILSQAEEYSELPVRHNEDGINKDMSAYLPIPVSDNSFESSHTKALLLLQAHLCRAKLPSTDYVTDLKSVLDQAIRILQAMIDFSSEHGMLITTLRCIHLVQMITQACWFHQSSLLALPRVEKSTVDNLRNIFFQNRMVECIPEVQAAFLRNKSKVEDSLMQNFSQSFVNEITAYLTKLPVMDVKLFMKNDHLLPENGPKQVPDCYGHPIHDRSTWLAVQQSEEYFLQVHLKRSNACPQYAATPRFPKSKLEGYFLLLSDYYGNVLAIKRIHSSRRSLETMTFSLPSNTSGRCALQLWLLSDSYIAMDQRYDIRLDIVINSKLLVDDAN